MKKQLICILISLSLIFPIFAFNGNGTKEKPFLISSFNDLKELQEAVDSGISYFGIHFKQTDDIIFPETNWNGIGEAEKGFAFSGIYDGNGHTISNIKCEEKHAGFFSLLSGEVKNLGIESGLISGEYIGGITSQGTGHPRIINCYNKAELIATGRAGGISDNISGEILFCWNFGEITIYNDEGFSAGISSYNANLVRSCFCTNKYLVSENFLGKIENSKVCDYDNLQKCLELYYDNLKTTKKTSSYSSLGIFPIIINENRIEFSPRTISNYYKMDKNDKLFSIFNKYPFEGLGTQEKPYLISSYEDFKNFRDFVDLGEDYKDVYFEQSADITFLDDNWEPIGERSFEFSYGFAGNFNGNGYKIYNINSNGKFVALFSYVDGNISNVNIASGSFSGEWAASIANEAGKDSKIISCKNNATISALISAAGIVEASRGYISDCYNYGEIIGLKENTNLHGICQFPKNEQIQLGCFSSDNLIKKASKSIISLKQIFVSVFFLIFLAILFFLFFKIDSISICKSLAVNILVKNKIFVFSCFLFTSFSVVQLAFGDKYGYYFTVNDNPAYSIPGDTRMDLYNSIIEESGDVWGAKNMEIYPPLAIFPYQIFVKLLSPELINNNGSHDRSKAVFLRNSMPGGVIGIVYDLLFILPFVFICFHFIHGDNWRKILYTTILCFSGLMIWTIERGNIIVYSFIFLLAFVVLYENSTKPLGKIFAIICLSIAANLKIYPAIFGLLVLAKKDFKAVWYTIFISFLIYNVFFFLCGYAPAEFGKNFLNVFSVSNEMTGFLRNLNFSAPNFLGLLNFLFVKITGRFYLLDYSNLIFKIYTLVMLAGGIFTFWFVPSFWKKLSALSLLCILIPTMSWQYTLIFLFIPLLYFINDSDDSKSSRYYAFLFALIVSILIIPVSTPLRKQPLTAGFVIQDFAVQLFAFSLFIESLKNAWRKHNAIILTIKEISKLCLKRF